MIGPTIDVTQASQRSWDAVVIGAGPSGATAARELARRGAQVLLVDKAEFPRAKVCGCCLNLRAIDTLRESGLDYVLTENGAVALRHVKIAARGRSAVLSLPGGVVLSREVFDAALIGAAIDAGVAFLPRTTATVETVHGQARIVSLGAGRRRVSTSSAVVLAAGGLENDAAIRNTGIAFRVARRSRIGAGTILDHAPAEYAAGTTYMSTSPGGYVGLVRLEDERLDVAAAFDPLHVKRMGGLGHAAVDCLHRAGLPNLPGLAQGRWHGTATLTRRPVRIAAERLFLIGDAAGYVEPFTGEGIACALVGAAAVVPLVLRGVERWDSSLARDWARLHRRLVVRRQFTCRLMSVVLRRPLATGMLIGALAALPMLASPFIERLNAVAYRPDEARA